MGGKWTFLFNYRNRQTLDLLDYQAFLITIRDGFTSQFAAMNPNEGEAVWTTPETTGNGNSESGVSAAASAGGQPSYKDNIFAQFSYKCTRTHANRGAGHGTWTLYWNPKLIRTQNKIHARCAPQLFKDLSNQIQEKLVEEFPQHFSLDWENGISGYDEGSSDLDDVMQAAFALMLLGVDSDSDDDDDHLPVVQEFDLSNDRCPHWYPWGYCPEECGLDLVDDYYY